VKNSIVWVYIHTYSKKERKKEKKKERKKKNPAVVFLHLAGLVRSGGVGFVRGVDVALVGVYGGGWIGVCG